VRSAEKYFNLFNYLKVFFSKKVAMFLKIIFSYSNFGISLIRSSSMLTTLVCYLLLVLRCVKARDQFPESCTVSRRYNSVSFYIAAIRKICKQFLKALAGSNFRDNQIFFEAWPIPINETIQSPLLFSANSFSYAILSLVCWFLNSASHIVIAAII